MSATATTIKNEPGGNGRGPRLPVSLPPAAAANNNVSAAAAKSVPSCFLHIVKDEPEDSDDVVVAPTVPGPGPATLVVSAEGGIVIKTEVLDEEDVAEDVNIDEVEEDEDDLDESDLDFDFDEEDKDDEDFELDSSEAIDTPDSDERVAAMIKKPEVVDDDDDNNLTEKGSFDFNGMTIETEGNYSKCPRCLKNIKSTFIIRHIKLHDAPSEKYECPEKGCTLQVRIVILIFSGIVIVSMAT